MMKHYKIKYIAILKNKKIRQSKFKFKAACEESALLAVENLLSLDMTVQSFSIQSVEAV